MRRSLDLDALFRGRTVPPWLRHFVADPAGALDELWLGRASLGAWMAADPRDLLLRWLDTLGEGGFGRLLDEAVAEWVAAAWGRPATETGDAAVVAEAWCSTAQVVGLSSALGGAADALRGRVVEGPSFLAGLSSSRSRDPLGDAWFALARHQHDESLRKQWWRLCSLPPEEPWYRGELGILGLRGMPTPDGRFPEHVGHGLVRLAQGLLARVREGWVDAREARTEWERITRQAMAGANLPDRWRAFWRAMAATHGGDLRDWLGRFAPGTQPGRRGRERTRVLVPDPSWPDTVKGLARRLREQEETALAEAERLIVRQARYADLTGDTHFVVRTCCYLARSVWEWRPEAALGWARRARERDPWNPYGWTSLAEARLGLGDPAAAAAVLREATRRFPDNTHAWNTLAKALGEAGRAEDAVAAAEEATRRFPDDAVARTTLAKALGEAGQAEDAVEVAEEAPHRVSDPDVARGRPAAVPGGAAAVQARTPVPSGTAPPRSAEDDSARLATLLGDGPVLRAWARRLHWTSGVTTPGTLSEEARRRIEPLLAAARADAQAAGQGGLVLAMVDRDGLTEALGLLREARQRFPGSAWVVYALAWAERQRWLRLEARERTPALRSEALRPWRALERLDARYRPVRLVGAARVWLTPDGADDPGSREALGEAAWQLHRWDDLADTATTTSAPFLDWWAGRARAALLPDPGVRRAEDLPPGLGDMSTNLADPEVSAELDALEQDYVGRFAVA